MAIIKSDFICDLNKPVKVQYLDGSLFSQDNMGNVFNVYVMDGDTPAVISGTVTADVIRSDGDTVAVSGTMSDNVCTVVFPQAVYAVPGVVSIVIKLTNDGTITTICAVVANVFRSTTDVIVDPGTIIPSIQSLIDLINTVAESVPLDYSMLWEELIRNDNATFDIVRFDWSKIGTQTYPTGWRSGYYNISTGAYASSNNYMRTTASPQIVSVDDDALFIHAKAPLGYYIAVCEYGASGVFVRSYGDMNPASEGATTEVYFNHTPGHGYRVNLGKFVNSDAATYAANSTFVAGIIFDVYYSLIEKYYQKFTEYLPETESGLQSSFTANKYWNTETSVAVLTDYTGSYYASNQIEVEPGQKYRVSIVAGTSSKQHPVIIADSSLNILSVVSRPEAGGDTVNTTVVIPDSGAYLLLNAYGEDSAGVYLVNLAKAEVQYDKLKLAKVAIIGDSISTNGNSGENPNVPEITITADDVGIELNAWLTYYDVQAGLSLGGHTFTSSEIGTKVTFTPTSDDIGKVIGLPNNYNPNSRTVWWEVALEKLGFVPIPVCWSGASITSHEADDSKYKTSYAWHEAQIRKCGIRIPGTMTRIEPDVIIIYRGTNDFSHTSYALLTAGYFNNYDWEYPSNDTVSGGYGYKEGLCLTIKNLRDAYPNAKIFICTLNVFKRVNYSHFPTNNGINSLPQYNDAIREVADFMGCGVIEFDRDGITFENCYSQGYITDSSTMPTHPSDKGHRVMGLKAIADLEAQYSKME